nr:unnamed protein product [Callosobruchus chinensis]
MVPFQGRLLFKQYNPQKCHKYGIKIFKLCSEGGYTWNMSIYAGREKQDDLLSLAHILLDKKTHFLGTLRNNRKGNPPEVIQNKLKKGEVIARENERGICVLKWRDKRDVLVLSTCHSDEMVHVQRRGIPIQKPKAIIDYNSGKSSIDLSDQMSSYSTALRRTIRWYKKLAIEVLLGTSIVNSHFIFKQVEQSDI